MTVREEKGEGGGVFRVWREDESKQGDGSGVRGAKEQIKRKIIYNLEMNIVIFLIFQFSLAQTTLIGIVTSL